MAEFLSRYGTRSASRCDKNQRKIPKTMTRPYIENITKGIITAKNSGGHFFCHERTYLVRYFSK